MTELEKHLKELEETWGYAQEELNDISEHLVTFALAAAHDSKLMKELIALNAENN